MLRLPTESPLLCMSRRRGYAFLISQLYTTFIQVNKKVFCLQDQQSVTIKVALDDGAPNLELKYVKGTDPAISAENFIRVRNTSVNYV